MSALPFVFFEPPLPPLMQVVRSSIYFRISSFTLAVEKSTTDIDASVFLHKPSVHLRTPAQMKPSFHLRGDHFIYEFSIICVHGLAPFLQPICRRTIFAAPTRFGVAQWLRSGNRLECCLISWEAVSERERIWNENPKTIKNCIFTVACESCRAEQRLYFRRSYGVLKLLPGNRSPHSKIRLCCNCLILNHKRPPWRCQQQVSRGSKYIFKYTRLFRSLRNFTDAFGPGTVKIIKTIITKIADFLFFVVTTIDYKISFIFLSVSHK